MNNDPSYKSKNKLLSKLMMAYIPLSFLTPVMMYQLRDNNRLIVIDGRHSYHITEYADKEKLIRLYEYTARLATDAFLMRNPNGLDRAVLFDEMYIGKARQAALDQLRSETVQFGLNEIHQKVEILNIKVLQADSRKSFVRIEGQLIRSFTQNGERGAYAVKFEAAMSLATNYDLAQNAVYPFVVTEMTYRQDEIKQ